MEKRALLTLITGVCISASACAQPAPASKGSDRPQSEGYGYGPGMMRGPGYGPGMMGGYGMGGGMMGGYGGGWGPNIPDLTNEQRNKIAAIQKEFRQKQWATMERMHESFAGTNTYRDGKFDEQAARQAYNASAEMHKQMFENHLETQKRIDSVLTPKQREYLQNTWGGR